MFDRIRVKKTRYTLLYYIREFEKKIFFEELEKWEGWGNKTNNRDRTYRTNGTNMTFGPDNGSVWARQRKRLGQTTGAFGLNNGSVWAKQRERLIETLEPLLILEKSLEVKKK